MPKGPKQKLTRTNSGRVFVLVTAAPTMLQSLYEYIPMIEGVTMVSLVTGAFDMIVVVEGNNVQRLLGTVLTEICQLDGVRETQTLVEALI